MQYIYEIRQHQNEMKKSDNPSFQLPSEKENDVLALKNYLLSLTSDEAEFLAKGIVNLIGTDVVEEAPSFADFLAQQPLPCPTRPSQGEQQSQASENQPAKKRTNSKGMMRCKSAKSVSPNKKDKTFRRRISPVKDADMIVIVSGETNLLNNFQAKTMEDSPEIPHRNQSSGSLLNLVRPEVREIQHNHDDHKEDALKNQFTTFDSHEDYSRQKFMRSQTQENFNKPKPKDGFYDKISSNSILGGYATKEFDEKKSYLNETQSKYEKLPLPEQSEEDLTQSQMQSYANGVDVKSGRVDIREWRKQMVNKGFKQGNYLVRMGSGSPRPAMDRTSQRVVNRLYDDSQKQTKARMKELSERVNEEQNRQCTFVPMTTKAGGGGSPRPGSVMSGKFSNKGSPDQSVTHKANDIQIYFKKESSEIFDYPGTNKNEIKQRARSRQNTGIQGSFTARHGTQKSINGGLTNKSQMESTGQTTTKNAANKSGIIGPNRFDKYYNDYVAKKKHEKELAKSMLKEKPNTSLGTSGIKKPTGVKRK